MTSMLEYLASLRTYGHTPMHMGTVTIGRTVYAAGSWFMYGSAELGIALMPIYRTDWVTHSDTGPTPALLPASYARSQRTHYEGDYGKRWMISGWNETTGVLWLAPITYETTDVASRVVTMHEHWNESFDAAMRLASPEVLARIEAASK